MSNDIKGNVELDELGLQKRRYEIDPPLEGKAGQRLAIGLVFANSILLLKNVLFGGDPAHTAPLPAAVGSRGAEAGQNVHDGQADGLARRADGEGDTEQPENSEDDQESVGSGTLLGNIFSAYEYDPGDGPGIRRPGSSNANNDNEALYLAKPGHAIGLVAEGHGSGDQGGPDAGGGDRDDEEENEDEDQGFSGGDDDDGGAGGDDGSGVEPGSDGDGIEDPDEDQHGGGSGGDGGNGGQDDGDSNPGSGGDGDEEPDDDDDDGSAVGPIGPIETRTNRLPQVSGSIVLAAILANRSVTITEASLLQGATDADGDALSVLHLAASSGSLVRRADGNWVFTPDSGDTSDVVFSYAISDGKGSITQTAFQDILPPAGEVDGAGRIVGTLGPDLLIGTPYDDWIDGLSGDDDILGREGHDIIHGGAGNDRIVAGDGDDIVFAGDGDDVVFAEAGDDIVFAGAGADIVFGDEGNDTLLGEDGDDTLAAGAGDDTADGGQGNDRLDGGDGHDTLIGGLGDDDIDAGSGDDVISAGDGNDTVAAGSGTDRIFAEAGDDEIDGGSGNDTVEAGDGNDTVLASSGDDSYAGGEGFDTFDLSATHADASVDLSAGTSTNAETGNDTLASFEAVIGGTGNDSIVGDEDANFIGGGAGGDSITDGGGDDVVDAGAGDDVVHGASGNDSYDGGDGADTFSIALTSADAVLNLAAGTASSAEIGDDTIVHFEIIKAGRGRDVIIASTAVETIGGGESEDLFVFSSSATAGRGAGGRDRILDFEVGDRIDLDDISKEFEEVFNDTFTDHGIRKFVIMDQHIEFTKPGQLKFKYDEAEDRTVLSGNIDASPEAEFEIEFAGNYRFTDTDFHSRS